MHVRKVENLLLSYLLKNSLFPPTLKETDLGRLPGRGRFPQIKGYDEALKFAESQLKPIVKEARVV